MFHIPSPIFGICAVTGLSMAIWIGTRIPSRVRLPAVLSIGFLATEVLSVTAGALAHHI